MIIGAHPITTSLQCAIEDSYCHYISNLEVLYGEYIEPLVKIVESGKKGGAHRFIAREKFRQRVEDEGSWLDQSEFDDIENGYEWDLIDGEPIYWMIWHDGEPPPEGLNEETDILSALFANRTVRHIYYVHHQLGYIYVFKSDTHTMGRLNVQARADYGLHPWTRVVVFGEDHPGFWDTEAPCVEREILQLASEYEEKGYDD
jgi:hypothetical protein